MVNSFEKKKVIIYLKKKEGRIKEERKRGGKSRDFQQYSKKKPSDYWTADTINNNKNLMTWNDCRLS